MASPPTPDDMALDHKGRSMPLSPTEVRATVEKMIDDGDVLAVVLRNDKGTGVAVYGPPSQATLDALETAVVAFRRMLEGH
jgi:hypothetical protein